MVPGRSKHRSRGRICKVAACSNRRLEKQVAAGRTTLSVRTAAQLYGRKLPSFRKPVGRIKGIAIEIPLRFRYSHGRGHRPGRMERYTSRQEKGRRREACARGRTPGVQ